MKNRLAALFLCLPFFLFLPRLALTQSLPAELAIPIKVSISKVPASIRLDWKLPIARPFPIWVQRKQANDTLWTMLAELGPNDTTFTDLDVKIGDAWEYNVRSVDLPMPNWWWRWVNGLVYAGIEVPPVTTSRGRILLLWDASLSIQLATELAEFEQNLRGDGWQLVRQDIDTATATVASVKGLIRQFYEQDTGTSRTVLLFGNLPVPYSGFINPDGHQDHRGAWPADEYYGDMDEQFWTDTTEYWPQYARPANQNYRGDGKFDPDNQPSELELTISRVDFSNLHGWDLSQTELYRRYLKKNLDFRSGAYRPPNRTIVDDNFYFIYQTGFAVNGYRNGHSLTGPGSVEDLDWFGDTERDSFLFGYACGGGSYNSAEGVGYSAQFMTDTVNVVFSQLFGSYFGDWDYELNPFMPSALASKGGILTCSWAGLPNWHLHHMALGMPIAYSSNWVHKNAGLQRDNLVYSPGPLYTSIHISLLGDPTLRLHYPAPPRNATASATCEYIQLQWSPSPEASHGYLVYRASAADGDFQLITPSPIADTFFIDTAPFSGSNFYQIKTLQLEYSVTGSYFNQSIGLSVLADFSPAALSFSAQTSPVSCFGGQNGAIEFSVAGSPQPPNYLWSNGASTQNLSGLASGTYTVTVSVEGLCSQSATFQVAQPGAAVSLQGEVSNPHCAGNSDGGIELNASGGTAGYHYSWSNGATEASLDHLPAGQLFVTVTDAAGCSQTAEYALYAPAPLSLQSSISAPKCHDSADGKITVTASGGSPGYAYSWSNGAVSPTISGLGAGNYTLTLRDTQGCQVQILYIIEAPEALKVLANEDILLPCGASVSLDATASGGTAPFQFQWSNGGVGPTIHVQTASQYVVTATDAHGCIQTDSTLVLEPAPIELTLTSVAPGCPGTADGSAMVTAAGGQGNFEFLWSTNETGAAISNLSEGEYTVTVTDVETACSKSQSFLLETAPLPDIPVSGLVSVCQNQGATYQIAGIDGPVEWTVSGGGQLFSGSDPSIVELLWTTGGQHILQAIFEHANGCADTSEIAVSVNICTEVQEPVGLAASVFPNPFEHYIEIRFAAPPKGQVLARLFDAQGRIVLSQVFAESAFRLETGFLAAGGYYLEVSDAAGVQVWRMVRME